MRDRRWLGLLTILVVLGATGCEAPLKPKSKRAESAPTASPSPSVRPDAEKVPTAKKSAKPAAPSPSIKIKVPKVPQVKAPSGPVLGGDISWPQCPKGMGIPERRTLGLPMPLPQAEYVVVGLTNGPGFTANPCLASQVDWIRQRHLLAAAYAVVSQPDKAAVTSYGGRGPFDGTTDLGALANTGYQQALANVATMRGAGLDSPIVWVDVEHVPDFEWSGDLAANGAVVQGATRGYADAGYDVGVYSTPALWRDVVGDLALDLPEWRAAG